MQLRTSNFPTLLVWHQTVTPLPQRIQDSHKIPVKLTKSKSLRCNFANNAIIAHWPSACATQNADVHFARKRQWSLPPETLDPRIKLHFQGTLPLSFHNPEPTLLLGNESFGSAVHAVSIIIHTAIILQFTLHLFCILFEQYWIDKKAFIYLSII